jgi:excisionase family DNA binding protein
MGVEERLERIERLVMLGSKTVLDTKEVALMLNLSESRIRHLVSERNIPHYKQGRITYFKKSEIEEWQLRHRIPTNDEIESKAMTYTSTHPKF